MSNRYPNARWLFLNSADASSINFSQVSQINAEALRYTPDGTQTFVKYNITEFPEDTSAENVDTEGNTYEFYYEITGSYSMADEEDVVHEENLYNYSNITGSGVLFASGDIVGRPSVYNTGIEISGKKEFTHPETLEILEGSNWTAPNPE
jgi:hypothetical protein